MAAMTPQDLKPLLVSGQRLLGLDVGTKTVGVALSDVSLTIASPMELIKRGKFAADAARLAEICARQNVGGIVLGLPIELAGAEGPRCQSIRQFARNLGQTIALPMAFWDERMSTAAVQRMLTLEADRSRARRAELVDKLAAAYILQGALDALRRPGTI